MPYENVLLDISGGVARLTLNRPDAANAMNLDLLRELAEALLECDESHDVRAVILTGNGRFFSAGGDLAAFAGDLDRLSFLLKQLTLHLHAAVSRIARMRQPVIAAVNGPAAGAGMALAAACDHVIAADTANFTIAYTAAGLSPDGSSTWALPRRIGPARTRELMLTNRRLSAAEALDWGLANEVAPAADLATRTNALATRFAAGPTAAYGRVKELLAASATNNIETQMELEARAIADSARTADAREGIDAFLSKRKPAFRGE
ncbi:enoyl-CoA hydratase/isomerase family protein [Hyphomonas sp.]|uniref:enoyl-CoA hydratase/isomerase family protein n=1 Tax=Hyphomonas sp. TaxID=87 RepID=UPI003F6EC7E8